MDKNVLLNFMYLHDLLKEKFCMKIKRVSLMKSDQKLINGQIFKMGFSKGILIKSLKII